MTSKRDSYVDGTNGRLGWTNHAETLFRAILGVVAVALGVAALAWHPTTVDVVAGVVLVVVGVTFVAIYARRRQLRQ